MTICTLRQEKGWVLKCKPITMWWHVRSKAQFYLLECLENCVSRSLRVYFAHAVKGTLKGSDHMFMLHNLFEMNEYFIMNKKYAFFLPRDVSSLSFTAAKAFSVCVFFCLSHFNSIRAQTAALCPCILNYLVVKAISSVITIILHSLCPSKICKAALVWRYSDYARGFHSFYPVF